MIVCGCMHVHVLSLDTEIFVICKCVHTIYDKIPFYNPLCDMRRTVSSWFHLDIRIMIDMPSTSALPTSMVECSTLTMLRLVGGVCQVECFLKPLVISPDKGA